MKQKLLLKVFFNRKHYLLTISFVFTIILLQSFFSHNALGQVANVNIPAGGFNIDGTLRANTAVGDWTQGTGTGGYVLQNNAGTWGPVDAVKTTFTRDGYGTLPDLIFDGGQFGDNPNTKWTWKSANSLNKCDIGTVLIHSTTSPTSKWLILGGDRLAQTGTSYIDFEFSQGLFTRLANGSFSSLSATGGSLLSTGGRTPGDFVLSMEYTNGGALATVHYYKWESAGSTYKFVEKPIPAPGGVSSAFGRSNTLPTAVPFSAFGSTTYAAYAFVEAAVNIDAIFAAECQSINIRSVFVKTKSSDAYSADLKDFVDPQPVNFVFGSAGLDYGATAFCQSGSINPLVPSPPNGTFSSAPSGLSFNTSTGAINLAGSNTGTYTITYAPSGGACIVPATATITIYPIPATPTASNSGPICSGSTLNLSTDVVANATYSWTGPNNFTSSLRTPSITNATTAATGQYSVTVTVNNCTSLAGSTTATVNAIPAIPSASNNGPICPGATLNLSTDVVADAAYSWTGPDNFTSSLRTPSIVNATTAATGQYSVTVTVNNCTSPAGSTTATVNPTPATPAASNNGPICPDATLNLSTDVVANATYSWTGPNNFTSSLRTPSIANATTAATGQYSVTVTVNNCTSLSGSTTATVNAIPATPSASNNGPICAGSTLNLSTDIVANATYSWTGPNNFTSSLRTPSITNATTAATGQYSVTVTVNNCTSLAGSTTATVNAIPATPSASNNGPICPGATLNLSTDVVANATYSWTGPNNFTSSLRTPSIANATTAATGQYSVTVTVNNCTSPAGSTTATVNPTPETPAASNNGPICAGATLNLSTDIVANATYSWTGPNNFTSSLRTPSITNATTAASGQYFVTVTVNNCTSLEGSTTATVNAFAATPTICVTQPSLCGSTTGSVTVLSPLDDASHDYEYRINGGAWQDATTFSGLAAGSLAGNATGVEVRLKGTECVSEAAKTCATVCTSPSGRTEPISQTEQKTNETEVNDEEAVFIKEVETINIQLHPKTLATAGPNPFTDKIRFAIHSGISGKGSLELYSMMGQKLKTVFEGYVEAGKPRNIEYFVPVSQRNNMIWVFAVGDQKVTGKLIGAK